MLIFRQLNERDRPLQILAGTVLAGLAVLLGSLWYVQVLSASRFEKDHQVQSFRTVRVPALRGAILDRNRVPLADNKAVYNLGVYLEELRPRFEFEYTNHVKKEFLASHLRSDLTQEKIKQLSRQSRYRAVSNLLAQVSAVLHVPCALNEENFNRHYQNQRSLLLPLVTNLGPSQVSVFEEHSDRFPEIELAVQSVRTYPRDPVAGPLAAHLLGHLRRDDRPSVDEGFSFRFLLPDYVGVLGLEAAYDSELRGRAGVKSVVVNHMAYRQSEEMRIQPEPGKNLVLTIDREIQSAAERALSGIGPNRSGAVVAMDVHSGDILAMASAPTFNPNFFVTPPTNWNEIYGQWETNALRPMFNHAASGSYEPGSAFKIVVALAGLESGRLNPTNNYDSPGYYVVGGRRIDDTAGAGSFDFERAFYRSSNPYFQHYGVEKIGAEKIIELGRRFHLGEPTGLARLQEARGYFPSLPSTGVLRKRDEGKWMIGDTANLSIGHGEVLVTPLQMVVLTAAVANGGKVLQPRLISAIEAQENATAENSRTFPSGVVRGELGVSSRTIETLQKAMLADVEHREGTGRNAAIPGFRICGKTGTAEITRILKKTWFVSYAPFENPRYAVVVVVEPGDSGGGSCAPIARKVYEALVKRERALQPTASARINPQP